MGSLLHRHLTYANVIATLALFVALGGTAWAAVKVTGRTIVDNTITSADVRNASLTGIDIRDRSLTARDFRAGTLLRGAVGPAGPAGAAGATGATGPQGVAGAQGPKGDPSYSSTLVVQTTGDAAANGTRLRTALQQAGTLHAASGRSSSDQVVVQLEPGDYEVSSQLVVPIGVSVIGPAIRAAQITVASGPFPDASVMRLDGDGGDGDRYLAHLSFGIFGATTTPATFTALDLGGNDVEAVELDVTVANTQSTTAVRGIAQTGDGGRFQLAGGRIYVSASGAASAFGIIDAASTGGSMLLQGVEVVADGSTAASAALRTSHVDTLGTVHASTLRGEDGALALHGVGTVRVFSSHLTGPGATVRTSGGGTDVTLIGGVLETTVLPVNSGGTLTCLDVFEGFAAADVPASKVDCA